MRSPVSTARAGPSSAGERDGRLDHGRAVVDRRLEADAGVERREHGARRVDPAGDARLLEQQLGAAARVGGDDAVGRAVARADVLGEGGPDDALERLGGQLHDSSTGSCPRRRTTWPSKAASSVG